MFNVMNNFKSKNHIGLTKLLVVGIFVLIFMLLVSTAATIKLIVREAYLLEREDTYSKHLYHLVEGSNYLTYQIFNYVVNEEDEHLGNYLYEIEVGRSREKAVKSLVDIGVSEEELDLVNGMLQLSNDLAKIEYQAIDLMEKSEVKEAQALIFSEEYTEYKDKIKNNYSILETAIKSRAAMETNNIKNTAIMSFVATLLIGIAIVLMAIILFFNFKKIEDEKDIDQLTGLQNRNKYKEKILKVIKSNENEYGALVYCDIDNLKFVNECYGHINGDVYLRAMAENLRAFDEYTSVMARPSGDEFIIYIHGFTNVEVLQDAIHTKINQVKNNFFKTTFGVEEKLRFSTGVSIYPIDAKNADDLIKYADYAMLSLKKSAKGEISFYDKEIFEKSIIALSNKGHLDNLIEKELLDFALQPIIDANTYEIYGYEALMRPRLDMVNTPFLLLQLAKEESKQDKIERLVFKKVFERINNNWDKFKKYKIFINSIADQVITESELEEFACDNQDIFKNIVVELTEQEYVDENILDQKTQIYKDKGALIALDDYGSGYSNEFTLINGSYNLIKIDMKLVNDIDKDLKRQEIVKSILKVSEINDFKVVAEGVETLEQAKMLKKLGVDYFQGYFFGRPNIDLQEMDKSVLYRLQSEM
ncbi:MAG: EAL domain-containing protein [Lachnospirales bacterium]